MDARKFIADSLGRLNQITETEEFAYFNHYIMNLPASAVDFLDAFYGIFKGKKQLEQSQMPTIHVYLFSNAKNQHSAVVQECERGLGHKLENPKVHRVRNVAPKKDMYCVSFTLPVQVAYSLKRKSLDP
jgi:tRNA (guanine37-N1)-methyltransferase